MSPRVAASDQVGHGQMRNACDGFVTMNPNAAETDWLSHHIRCGPVAG
jgi:hypothetical protein